MEIITSERRKLRHIGIGSRWIFRTGDLYSNEKRVIHKGNPDKEVFLAGDSRMMRERHAVVSFSYLLYSGDKSISPMKV